MGITLSDLKYFKSSLYSISVCSVCSDGVYGAQNEGEG